MPGVQGATYGACAVESAVGFVFFGPVNNERDCVLFMLMCVVRLLCYSVLDIAKGQTLYFYLFVYCINISFYAALCFSVFFESICSCSFVIF